MVEQGIVEGVREVEIIGFVGWVTSSVAYVLFLLWAYLPDSVLEAHGITYYPSKYWAVALPAWACVTVVFAVGVYESLGLLATPPASSAAQLYDPAAKRPEDAGMRSHFSTAQDRVPPLVDIPAELASMVLYGGKGLAEAEAQYIQQQWQRRQLSADSSLFLPN